MTTLATTADTRDLFLDSQNNLAMVSDAAALANIMTNVLRTQRGELQFDVQSGIPYLETVFKSRSNISLWKGFMIEAMEALENVIRVKSFDITVSGNLLTYEAEIETTYGVITVNG